MFKAIKDEKIIAINETEIVGGLEYDEQIEDTEHTVDDYEQYNGEYLLKEDIPVDYKNEQIRLQRQARFQQESDPLKLDYDEASARLNSYSGEDEYEIASLKEKVDSTMKAWLDKKDEIRIDLPYVEVKVTRKRKKASE